MRSPGFSSPVRIASTMRSATTSGNERWRGRLQPSSASVVLRTGVPSTSDDPRGFQRVDPLRGEAEHAPEDLVVMLPERRPHRVDASGRLRQPRDDVRQRELARALVRYVGDVAAGLVLRILEDLVDGVD